MATSQRLERAVWTIAVLALGSINALGGRGFAAAEEKIELRDGQGRIRFAVGEGEKGQFALTLLDGKGVPRSRLTVDDGGASRLSLMANAREEALSLSVRDDGSAMIVLHCKDGEVVVGPMETNDNKERNDLGVLIKGLHSEELVGVVGHVAERGGRVFMTDCSAKGPGRIEVGALLGRQKVVLLDSDGPKVLIGSERGGASGLFLKDGKKDAVAIQRSAESCGIYLLGDAPDPDLVLIKGAPFCGLHVSDRVHSQTGFMMGIGADSEYLYQRTDKKGKLVEDKH